MKKYELAWRSLRGEMKESAKNTPSTAGLIANAFLEAMQAIEHVLGITEDEEDGNEKGKKINA